ncbi:alpha/beta hydrolase family protein [Asticcacaulis solisilvae]|uniref:alpha/beta hydrolase family protein n=1 Tax=Asticcacaulis solisilvae TaxID=1217274 RepID=UPI003FD8632D
MNRRDLFLTSAAFLWLGPLATRSRADTAAPGPLKPEFFTRDAFMSPPQLSPDGTHLAWIENNQIIIHDLKDNSEKGLNGAGNRLEVVQWVGNDYLVVYLKDDEVPKTTTYVKVFSHSPMVITRDAKYVRQLFQRGDKKLTYDDLAPVVRFIDGPAPYLITLERGYTTHIDLATGKRTTGEPLLPGSDHFFDRQGRERMSAEVLDGKVSYGATAVVVNYRPQPGAASQALRLPKQDNIYYLGYQYSEFDNSIYWSEFDYTKGLCSIWRHDIASGEKSLYRSGPNKDMTLTFDPYGHIVGITTVTDRVHTEWTAPYHLKMVGAVEKFFPNAFVDIADMTEDGRHIVFLVSAPEAPDSYYYYSAQTKDLVRVGANYPELDGQALAAMTYVTYKARDGLDIPAYVTARKDTPPNAPLIVMPHGGPRARDVYGFDYQAQYFASKGYVVLQPQYRGSAGFGDTFERAGNIHLDKMTTDLEDGVRYLAAQGRIDPKRVGVAGWSWGGYLAEAALAFTPETYACGIAGAGISDLFDSLEDDNDIFWGGYSMEYWQGVIGRPMRDSAQIHATSPIEHIDAIRAPLLLIHGDSDDNVKVRHSRKMNDAMKRAGKDVTYLEVKFMRHGPNDAAQRLTVLEAMDAFVTKVFAKVG